jgi:hypothetical protein
MTSRFTRTLPILLVVACGGGKEPETPKADPVQSAAPAARKAGPSMSQELGSLDPKEVDKVFARLTDKFLSCQKASMSRVEFLAGDVKFFVRIGANGQAKYAYMEDSTLGDREAEKCMVQEILSAAWPKPDGGEGEARKSFGFDAGDARAPAAWGSDRISAAVTKHEADLQKCTGGQKGFHITLYVEPHGKEGKVLAVGVSAPNRDGAGKVDCIVDALKHAKVPSPGSYAAKVTFTY